MVVAEADVIVARSEIIWVLRRFLPTGRTLPLHEGRRQSSFGALQTIDW